MVERGYKHTYQVPLTLQVRTTGPLKMWARKRLWDYKTLPASGFFTSGLMGNILYEYIGDILGSWKENGNYYLGFRDYLFLAISCGHSDVNNFRHPGNSLNLSLKASLTPKPKSHAMSEPEHRQKTQHLLHQASPTSNPYSCGQAPNLTT